MAKRIAPLSDAECRKAKQGDAPLYDGNGGLRLVMSKTTPTKTWQYRINKATLQTTVTIGKYTKDGRRIIMSLAEARDKFNELAKLVAKGIDPNEEKKQKRLEESKTFKQVALLWYETSYSKNGVDSATAQKTLGILHNHVFPTIGKKRIDSITHNDLCKVIRIIEAKGLKDTPVATKGYLKRIFAKAFISGYIANDPSQHLDQEEFKIIEESNRPSLPLEKLPELHKRMAELIAPDHQTDALSTLFFKFALHTFTRLSELRFARWDEFNFENRTWIIPARRGTVENCPYSGRGAKMRREHVVPLSHQAFEILLEIKKQNYGISSNVFPHRKKPAEFISRNTGTNYIKRLGYCVSTEFTLHGIRDMACSTISDSGLFCIEAIEKQMSHETKNKVRKTYTRQVDYMQERRQMMQFWSDYLDANKQTFIKPSEFALSIIKDKISSGQFNNGDSNDDTLLMQVFRMMSMPQAA